MEIDHSRPRIRRLLIGPAPPSTPAVQCPAYPAVVFRTDSERYHPPTRASPVSVPAYQKTFARLSLTRHFQRPTLPLFHRPYHACRITVAVAPTLPPNYILMWLPAVVLQSPVTTTAIKTSPLPHIPSHSHIPQI